EELVLDTLRPDVEQDGIGDVQLADLDDGQGQRPREDKHHGVGGEPEKGGHEPHREEPDHGPEGDLEEGEGVAAGHAPVANEEGRHLDEGRGHFRSSMKTDSRLGSTTTASLTATPWLSRCRRSSGSRL